MDSNRGFSPASGAWRGRDIVGRTRLKSQKPARRVFSLSDEDLSPEAVKFGRGGCGLVESIFPKGKVRFSAMRVCKFFL
jgi:hypothetical protein